MGQKTETAADVFTGLGWVAVIAAGSLVTVLGVSTLGSYGFGGVTEAALEFADMQNPEVVGAAKNLGFFGCRYFASMGCVDRLFGRIVNL